MESTRLSLPPEVPGPIQQNYTGLTSGQTANEQPPPRLLIIIADE
jgi:hypothetical protein